jgi:hypothetical protein
MLAHCKNIHNYTRWYYEEKKLQQPKLAHCNNIHTNT